MVDVLNIPFHRLLGLKRTDRLGYVFMMEEQASFLNHLGTIHACVQLSLAEASAGEFLLQEFAGAAEGLIPVVRKTEVKYHKPGNGVLYCKAAFVEIDKADFLKDLQEKGRAQLQVKTEVHNEEGTKVLSAIFDWFIAKA
jgi:hypothetical protein